MYNFKPMPVLIRDRAQNTPTDAAIECITSGITMSWSELDSNCRLWADAYRRLGVEPGEYVVTMMPNTPDATLAWIGCAWLRAVEVPINTEYRGDWLTHAINISGARVIITSRRFVPALCLVADDLPHVRRVVVYDALPDDDLANLASFFHVLIGDEFFADAVARDGLPEPRHSDLMSVIYTSGTTGRAKAVQLPWGLQESTRLIYAPREFSGSTLYGFWPPFHMLGKSLLFVPSAFGGKLVTRERFSITDFWSDIRKYDCTTTYTVSVIASFLQSMPPQDDDADNPLEAVIMGPVVPDVDEFKRRFGVKVYTTFGSTELGGVLFSFPRDVTNANFKSVGQVVEESPTEVALVDENDFPVADGSVGELIVRPKVPWTMNQGYLNMPEATVRAWRNGWYHTGDAFIRDADGEYFFVDRAKDYIRRRGENISSFEVEQAVTQYPGIAQAAALAVPSEVGEDEVLVVVVPASGETIEPAALCEFLSGRVPKFALPRYIKIRDSLPVTQATFRVQKAKLREEGVDEHTYDRLADAG